MMFLPLLPLRCKLNRRFWGWHKLCFVMFFWLIFFLRTWNQNFFFRFRTGKFSSAAHIKTFIHEAYSRRLPALAAATVGSMFGSTFATNNEPTVSPKVRAAINQLAANQTAMYQQMAALSFSPPPTARHTPSPQAFHVPPIQNLAIPMQQQPFVGGGFNQGMVYQPWTPKTVPDRIPEDFFPCVFRRNFSQERGFGGGRSNSCFFQLRIPVPVKSFVGCCQPTNHYPACSPTSKLTVDLRSEALPSLL